MPAVSTTIALGLAKFFKEKQSEDWTSFKEWLEAVEKEAQELSDVWQRIAEDFKLTDDATLSDESFARLHAAFLEQSRRIDMLNEFYAYASAAATGSLKPKTTESLVQALSRVLKKRHLTKKECDDLIQITLENKLFFLDGTVGRQAIDSAQSAIRALQKELAALKVLIKTIKANRRVFK